MKGLIVSGLVVFAALCVAAMPLSREFRSERMPPERECLAGTGDACNKQFNFCNGSSGTCTQCTFSGFHSKCNGAVAPCVTHYTGAGCGVRLTASCDTNGECTGWTSTGPDCSLLECGP